ncbi:hypothetical protein PN498_17075 [Oscillatoria sp. CS-180]|uniref:hypothetical protein n=1 Tax=Oscillatoria sp. CS-180 TaxID=3021720 RepID=UPI002330B841|nr:hypothetical protein [Oscillatoria sp. CS-180]MDB9527710.1 hypothetical protein [Oscillatoria sp. CS-180]
MIIDPHYPDIVLAFPYRGLTIEIEQGSSDNLTTYAAWVNYETGCAVAVPRAWTRADAIQRAKRWVDRKFYTDSSSI